MLLTKKIASSLIFISRMRKDLVNVAQVSRIPLHMMLYSWLWTYFYNDLFVLFDCDNGIQCTLTIWSGYHLVVNICCPPKVLQIHHRNKKHTLHLLPSKNLYQNFPKILLVLCLISSYQNLGLDKWYFKKYLHMPNITMKIICMLLHQESSKSIWGGKGRMTFKKLVSILWKFR